MPVFIDVEYVHGWCLFVVLSDGTTGVLDLTPWRSQPLFAALDSERRCAGSSSIAATSWSGPRAAPCRPRRSIT